MTASKRTEKLGINVMLCSNWDTGTKVSLKHSFPYLNLDMYVSQHGCV